MQDTSNSAKRRYFELLAQLSPEQRLQKMNALTMDMRNLVMASLRAEHPGLSDEELKPAFAERVYGRAVRLRLFPESR